MNKTTYIILGIVAVIAVIAAIYFYKKSKETTIVIPPPAPDNKTQGIFNLVAGLGTVLGNVNWQSIFGGNGGNNQYNQPLDIQNCGGMARWNGTQCVQ